jgi:hypothetical protein
VFLEESKTITVPVTIANGRLEVDIDDENMKEYSLSIGGGGITEVKLCVVITSLIFNSTEIQDSLSYLF